MLWGLDAVFMRAFELLIVGLLASGAVWSLVGGTRATLSVFFGLDVLALILHLLLEGAHWQMGPAYVGVLVFAGVLFLGKPGGRAQGAGAWVMIGLALAACCFAAILPMFRLPRPTGPLAIGTRIFHLVDESRTDASNGDGKRELMVQIWYPAAPSRNRRAPYRRRQETTLLSSYQSVVPTHARWDPPVATGQNTFPVLLFNPAWNGRRTQNTYLVEDLVSHGFVVAGIDHTYNSGPVAFPDGRVIHPVPVPDMQDFSHTTIEKVNAIGARELATETADDIFVLNELEAMNRDSKSIFYGRLDTNTAGAFGHSFGGAVAAEACRLDPRIHAALDLDGSLFGPIQREGLDKPFMLIEEEVPHYTPEELSRLGQGERVEAELNQSDDAMFAKYGGYRIFLRGSTHVSFTDKVLFSPFKRFSGRGDIAPRRELSILRKYALAFFDQTLKGISSPLLNAEKSPFPEADFIKQGVVMQESGLGR